MAENSLPLLTFADAAGFERWLDDNGEASAGAWLRFAKQSAPEATLSKSDAIDCVLAHGWVDGQLGRVDAHFFKTRFTHADPGASGRRSTASGWKGWNRRAKGQKNSPRWSPCWAGGTPSIRAGPSGPAEE